MKAQTMNLAHYDAPTLRCPRDPQAYSAFSFSPRPLAQPEPSWRLAYERVRGLGPAFWRAQRPLSPAMAHAPAPAFIVPGREELDRMAVADEVQRALDHGKSDATPRALLFLAILALQHDGEHAQALGLARTALDEAAAGQACRDLHPRYLALVTPLAATFDQAARELVAICENAPMPACAPLYLAGAAHAAGMPLLELVRRLDTARRAPAEDAERGAAAELDARAGMLGALLHGEHREHAPQRDAAGLAEVRFGYWLSVLQGAWYAGDRPLALRAIERADPLAGALAPPADRLCYHLFAALTLAQEPTRKPDGHCAALRRMARHHPRIAADYSALADAAHAGRHGDALAALRGYEAAADAAGRGGRHLKMRECSSGSFG